VETFHTAEFFGDQANNDPGKVFTRNFDLVEFAWLTGYLPPCELFTTEQIPGPPDALNPDGSLRYPEGWQGNNAPGYSNTSFDAACQEARASLPGEAAFAEAHWSAQAIFAAELPVIPLFFRTKITASRADFCGLKMDPTEANDFWNLEAFDFGEGCP
jgi:peptide/nickel transport system substrate-binding protein